MIRANTFSASLYSNECSNAVARLKSPRFFSAHEKRKFTVPNSSAPDPQRAISPVVRSNDLMSSANCFRSAQENAINAGIRTRDTIRILLLFIVAINQGIRVKEVSRFSRIFKLLHRSVEMLYGGNQLPHILK